MTIHLTFLWHMHQPYYRNDTDGTIFLPWVRLHSLKHYYDIPAILANNGNAKFCFNLVPSLLKQIQLYSEGSKDFFEQTALKEAEILTDEDKVFILDNFFMLHENLINNLPEFKSLFRKFISLRKTDNLEKITSKFSIDEYRDLQVLYHLAWSGWKLRSDEVIQALIEKKRSYTENDKKILFEKQRDFIKDIIPFYSELIRKGKIEVSTTPFYHPILPLLFDYKSAEVAIPDIKFPENISRFEEDAKSQLQRGIEFFQKTMQKQPNGLWPSEGSVSNPTLDAAIDNGLKWIASDDEVLKRSLQQASGNQEIDYCTPYLYTNEKGSIAIFFRNHNLSDKIGFAYSRMSAKDAIEDFISTVLAIGKNSKNPNPLVSVILDGENAWEFFKDNGYEFLSSLSRRLDTEKNIETVTFTEYLDSFHDSLPKLKSIYPGSWIYANFGTWIGHPEKNRAWELISKTKSFFDAHLSEDNLTEEIINQIKEEFYIAEGSDWFWWYGDDHHTEFAIEFDSTFRTHLINVYSLLGVEPPGELQVPIIQPVNKGKVLVTPSSFIEPKLDGLSSTYFEWLGSVIFDPHKQQGAIHRSDFKISKIRYGFNTEMLFIRIESNTALVKNLLEHYKIKIDFLPPVNRKVIIDSKENVKFLSDLDFNIVTNEKLQFGIEHTLEMGFRWDLLGEKSGDLIQFKISLLDKKDLLIEQHPFNIAFEITIPDSNFEGRDWIV